MEIPMTITKSHSTIDDIPGLVREAKEKPAAFARLYDCFVTSIYRYLYSRVGNPTDAEDLTAQTFLTALEKLPKYREQGQFKAWLFTIARSKAMDHFRGNHPDVSLDLIEAAVPQNDPLTEVIRTEQTELVAGLIRSLEDSEQELLRLRYVADLTFAEMGALLNKSEDAVKKSLYRLQDRMQSRLEVEK